ncbi:DNA glycosylase AlkZ-like family protein [Cocleimonas flava]|uniref:DNA glycosylase AlkZ-like family protein n=1 Tax=Cocleimonas flava TaxID=634765 RepID=UPI003C72CDBE
MNILVIIQIDTISVIQRAHHHTLWNRNPRYKPEQLDQLIADKKVFEYWSHAAAYMPMCNYRYLSRRIMGNQHCSFLFSRLLSRLSRR